MIQETIEITCDKCGKSEKQTKLILYRASGNVSVLIVQLSLAGWKFARDDNFLLLSVTCPLCEAANDGTRTE